MVITCVVAHVEIVSTEQAAMMSVRNKLTRVAATAWSLFKISGHGK
jgi:hypothetical protein